VNKNLLAMLVLTIVLLMDSHRVYAHHSVAQFDMEHLTDVTGIVTKFEWSNPHTYIYLDVKGDKGAGVKWITELRSVPNLSRVGWTRDTLKPGDKIIAHGHRAKDGRAFMIIARIELANGQVLTNGPESLSQTSHGQ
jgi:hypothetical protein